MNRETAIRDSQLEVVGLTVKEALEKKRGEVKKELLEKKRANEISALTEWKQMKTSRAERDVEELITKFSTRYFGKSDTWYTLTADQRHELKNECVSYCKKRVAAISSCMILPPVSFLGLATNFSPLFMAPAVAWCMVNSIMLTDWHVTYRAKGEFNFWAYIRYLRARRFLASLPEKE